MSHRSRKWIRRSSALALLALIGCQSEAKEVRAPMPGPTTAAQAANPAAAEQCAANMHDLCGELLRYYVTHWRFPETLEELQASPGSLLCPATGQPYVYHAAGLGSIRDERSLILHDRELAHSGLRIAIVASPPKDKQPPGLWVVELDEATFLTFMARPEE